jgi:hypothetical protein
MKVNSLSLQEKETQFEQDLDYEEWLKYNNPEPTNDVIDNMEQVSCKSIIVNKSSHNPINTFNYQALQGA